ncbi:hypothetical protein [Paraglaciecola aestuariivivens]
MNAGKSAEMSGATEVANKDGLFINIRWRKYKIGAIAYLIIMILIMLSASFFPQRYISSTSIDVRDNHTLKALIGSPMLDKSTESTLIMLQSAILSPYILRKVLFNNELLSEDSMTHEVDTMLAKVKERVRVTVVEENLYQLEYSDSLPNRAQSILSDMTHQLINIINKDRIKEAKVAVDSIEKMIREEQVIADNQKQAPSSLSEEKATAIEIANERGHQIRLARDNLLLNSHKEALIALVKAQDPEQAILRLNKPANLPQKPTGLSHKKIYFAAPLISAFLVLIAWVSLRIVRRNKPRD